MNTTRRRFLAGAAIAPAAAAVANKLPHRSLVTRIEAPGTPAVREWADRVFTHGKESVFAVNVYDDGTRTAEVYRFDSAGQIIITEPMLSTIDITDREPPPLEVP